MKINELNFDNHNANKHTQKGLRLLEKSLSKLGAGRSILIDKDNNIIAGNGVVEVAGQIGLDKIKVIETDGTELIAVKRKDVSINSKKGRELAIADNQTAKTSIDFDSDLLNEVSGLFDLDLGEWEMEGYRHYTGDELDKFFLDRITEKTETETETIVLHFEPDLCDKVKARLLEQGGTYEEAVLNWLGLKI
jgi:hypothetical protein